MFISIFVIALVISAFFDQQQRRHRLELQLEYEKLGKKMPEERPKLQMLESIANIVVGLILVEMGALSLWAFLSVLRKTELIEIKFNSFGQIDLISAMLAGGIALLILGARSVRTNLKYRGRLVRKA